jgi:hypothetical protein
MRYGGFSTTARRLLHAGQFPEARQEADMQRPMLIFVVVLLSACASRPLPLALSENDAEQVSALGRQCWGGEPQKCDELGSLFRQSHHYEAAIAAFRQGCAFSASSVPEVRELAEYVCIYGLASVYAHELKDRQSALAILDFGCGNFAHEAGHACDAARRLQRSTGAELARQPMIAFSLMGRAPR